MSSFAASITSSVAVTERCRSSRVRPGAKTPCRRINTSVAGVSYLAAALRNSITETGDIGPLRLVSANAANDFRSPGSGAVDTSESQPARLFTDGELCMGRPAVAEFSTPLECVSPWDTPSAPPSSPPVAPAEPLAAIPDPAASPAAQPLYWDQAAAQTADRAASEAPPSSTTPPEDDHSTSESSHAHVASSSTATQQQPEASVAPLAEEQPAPSPEPAAAAAVDPVAPPVDVAPDEKPAQPALPEEPDSQKVPEDPIAHLFESLEDLLETRESAAASPAPPPAPAPDKERPADSSSTPPPAAVEEEDTTMAEFWKSTVATPAPEANSATEEPTPGAEKPKVAGTAQATERVDKVDRAWLVPAPQPPESEYEEVQEGARKSESRRAAVVFIASVFFIGAIFGLSAAAVRVPFLGVLDKAAGQAVGGSLVVAGAVEAVLVHVLKTPPLLQVIALASLVVFIRAGLQPTLAWVYKRWAAADPSRNPWEKSIISWLFKDVYGPVEVPVMIATACTFAEAIVKRFWEVPTASLLRLTNALTTVALIVAVATVMRNWQTRYFGQMVAKAELDGRTSNKARIQGVQRLASIITFVVATLFSAHAVGFDLNSLLAVGGISGLAIGLAGREILGNVFMGIMLYATQPFSPGEHVKFTTNTQRGEIDGIVVDVGLFRTTVRSFEREYFMVPNSVFSSSVLLNVTRKGKEWRFEELLMVRHSPLDVLEAAIADIRSVLRSDERVLKSLHRRVFVNKITMDGYEIIVSCYVEAANRDQYMAIKDNLFLIILEIFSKNGLLLSNSTRLLDFANPAITGILTQAMGAGGAIKNNDNHADAVGGGNGKPQAGAGAASGGP